MANRSVMRLFGPIILSATLLCGCATTHTPSAPAAKSGIERPRNMAGAAVKANERKLLSGYRRERGCDGPAYARARDYAVSGLESVVSDSADAGNIGEAAKNGQFRLSLAETAARKRCVDVARKAYTEVVEIFTGPPYAGLRKRAAAGINRLGNRPSPATPARAAPPASQPE